MCTKLTRTCEHGKEGGSGETAAVSVGKDIPAHISDSTAGSWKVTTLSSIRCVVWGTTPPLSGPPFTPCNVLAQ